MKILSNMDDFGSREKVSLECAYCKGEFKVVKRFVVNMAGDERAYLYCSRKCKSFGDGKWVITKCFYCGSRLERETSPNGRYFCNQSCSSKYSHERGCYDDKWTDERRRRASEKAIERGFKPPTREKGMYTRACLNCNASFKISQPSYVKKYCRDCQKLKMGGFRQNSTKVHRSMYKDSQMDSGAELLFAKLLDEAGIRWQKNSTVFFEYVYDGKDKKYYPDFFLPELDLWIEIKGKRYVEPWLPNKLEAVKLSGKRILLIDSESLKDKESVLVSLMEVRTGIQPA